MTICETVHKWLLIVPSLFILLYVGQTVHIIEKQSGQDRKYNTMPKQYHAYMFFF